MPKSCFYPLLLLLGGSLPLLAQEWVTLFDGKSFAGWDNRPIAGKLAWTIEDGCLTAIPGSTRADLMTLREFRDFELEFEWKVPPAGNSGVKYKLQAQYYFSSPRGATKSSEVIILPHLRPAPEAGRLAVIGFEYQVAADDTTADTKRGAKWASAAAVEMVEAILKDKKKILPCAAYCTGQYGLDGLFVGVPVKLGANGIEQIIEVELTESEAAALKKSAEAVKELTDRTKELLFSSQN